MTGTVQARHTFDSNTRAESMFFATMGDPHHFAISEMMVSANRFYPGRFLRANGLLNGLQCWGCSLLQIRFPVAIETTLGKLCLLEMYTAREYVY